MKHLFLYSLVFTLLFSCGNDPKIEQASSASPIITENGKQLQFPEASHLSFFKTEILNERSTSSEFTAPAKIAATVLPSREGAGQNLILFENPELASHYTQFMQLQIDINHLANNSLKQRRLELERTQDLNSHGVATGQDLLDAQSAVTMEESQLSNNKAALIEHESKLRSEGFSLDKLKKAKVGTSFLICDIPESQSANITEGDRCSIRFSALPTKEFRGSVDAIADVIDANSRMLKARIQVDSASAKLKSGMYAQVTFKTEIDNNLSIDKNAVVTVNGKHYVFKKQSANEFERTEITTGQEIGNRIIVHEGLFTGDEVAIEGVLQLKGLSFGY